jgi:hypothetical protein
MSPVSGASGFATSAVGDHRTGQGRRRRKGHGHVRGVARSIELRSDAQTLSFRVDTYDGSGNRLDPVAVEIRRYRSGQISEGEEVDVIGKWSNGTLRSRKVVNLSTNADVRAYSRVGQVLVLCFFLALFLGLVGYFIFLAKLS